MKQLLIIAVLLTRLTALCAQSKIEKTMNVKDSSFSKTITLEIKQGTQKIDWSAQGFISQGSLSLIAFDPEGKREGGFGLEASGNQEPGKGKMTHVTKMPLAGTWKFLLELNHVTGNLYYLIKID